MNDEELIEYGRQLAHPRGEAGLEIAEMLNETNSGMTNAATNALNITDGNVLLELGHGNCGHLDMLLDRADDLQYNGLEVSEDMYREASRRNSSKVESGTANFFLYEGEILPFEDETFDRVITVNTIYFWKDAAAMCKELARVLNPGGVIALAFGEKFFMKELPFTRQSFNLVDSDEVVLWLELAGLTIEQKVSKVEKVKTRSGDLVDRPYTVVSASKK